MNGVPSSRREQSDRQRAKLWDLPLIGHGPDGLGTGGGTAAFDATPYFLYYGFQSNPLGLGDDTLFSKAGTLRQALDVKTLHPDDEVIPLIGMIPPGQSEPLPVATIVRHNCREFRGAVDVWLGQAAPQVNPAHEFLNRQLVVRSVAWRLAEKGSITHDRLNQLYAALDKEERLAPLPFNLPTLSSPNPMRPPMKFWWLTPDRCVPKSALPWPACRA